MSATEYSPPLLVRSDGAEHLFQLFTYVPSSGYLDEVHRRFREKNLRLYEKNGITSIGFWAVNDERPQRLIFMLRHKDKESAEASWENVRKTPAFLSRREMEEQLSRIPDTVTSAYLRATDYSALK